MDAKGSYDHLPYTHVEFARDERPPVRPIAVVRGNDGRIRFFKGNFSHLEARIRAILVARHQYPLTDKEAKEVFALFNLVPSWVTPKRSQERPMPFAKRDLPKLVVMPEPPGQEAPLQPYTIPL